MVSLPLAGLNIVVTRPRDQAAGLTQRIEDEGGKPVLFPLLEISPASDTHALRELAQRLPSYDLLIFISPNAVNYGMAALGKLPDTVRVATVGQSSAQALRDRGIAHVIVPTGRFDSEALLALPELQHVSDWRVAIMRGDGGRELLGDTLKARGAQLEYIACYQRSKPALAPAALMTPRPDVITVTSSEALNHLWDMLEESDRTRLAAIPLFVPHERIATLARQQGWKNIVPTAAGDDGLLSALVAWAKQRNTESQP